MTFSAEIKEELSNLNTFKSRNKAKFELLGFAIASNTLLEGNFLVFKTENIFTINRYRKLINNLFKLDPIVESKGKTLIININIEKLNREFAEIVNFTNVIDLEESFGNDDDIDKSIVRGVFMGSGTLNNLDKKYHLEIGFSSIDNLKIISKLLLDYEIKNNNSFKNNINYIYIKSAEEISKFLAFIGANDAVLKFEEMRVFKDIRNTVNRKVNCETYNLSKTVNASMRQVEDIEYLIKIKKINDLPKTLREIAILRIENKDASLQELVEISNEDISKSGLNYRFKKISEVTEKYRK